MTKDDCSDNSKCHEQVIPPPGSKPGHWTAKQGSQLVWEVEEHQQRCLHPFSEVEVVVGRFDHNWAHCLQAAEVHSNIAHRGYSQNKRSHRYLSQQGCPHFGHPGREDCKWHPGNESKEWKPPMIRHTSTEDHNHTTNDKAQRDNGNSRGRPAGPGPSKVHLQ